jgi:hypothetical protein
MKIMKNTFKTPLGRFLTIAFVTAVGFLLMGCPDVNDDTTGGGSAVTYTGTDSSRNAYSLKITEKITVTVADKAGYTISPKFKNVNVYYYQTSGGETDVFTSIEDMTAWLNEQDANTAANPYTVKLNVADLTGMSGSAFSGKYVNLDLG